MKRLLLAALLCAAAPAYAAQLSEDSQREVIFSQCMKTAMERGLPQGPYVQACMGARGWVYKPNENIVCNSVWVNTVPLNDSQSLADCYVRMK
jgi:hypothetical protein